MKPAIWTPCVGSCTEPHTDNCGSCAPFWRRIACCPSCEYTADFGGGPRRLVLSKSRKSGFCHGCFKRFAVKSD